jgi:hypothetical protein
MIAKTDFKETLKSCFPSKSADQIEALVKVAEDELGSSDHSKIEYKHLFGEVNLIYLVLLLHVFFNLKACLNF